MPSRTKKLQPATSATAAVSSPEPPSAISTSLIMPAVAPDTSAAKVGTKARSESLVAMMTLSMRLRCLLWIGRGVGGNAKNGCGCMVSMGFAGVPASS